MSCGQTTWTTVCWFFYWWVFQHNSNVSNLKLNFELRSIADSNKIKDCFSFNMEPQTYTLIREEKPTGGSLKPTPNFLQPRNL